MDDAAWTALALTLTLLGSLYTWFVWRRRGAVAGLRGAALTLLAPAAWLTDTLRMFTRVADAIGDWAIGLVFSPVVWAGVVLAGLSVLLFLLSGILASRGLGSAPRRRERTDPAQGTSGTARGGARERGAPAIDDDLADIEALLRKRGIS